MISKMKSTIGTTSGEGSQPARGRASQAGAAGAAISGAGAALVATAATACCSGPIVAPLIVTILGASGAAWAAGLKPYSPWLLGASFLALIYGFRLAYRKVATCDMGTTVRRPMSTRLVRGVLWVSAVLWLAAVVANLTLRS